MAFFDLPIARVKRSADSLWHALLLVIRRARRMPRISAGTAFRRDTRCGRIKRRRSSGSSPAKDPRSFRRFSKEIARFLEAVAGLRNRVALVVRLKISSIDSKGMLIHIESHGA
jgi:hypothetical protein